MKTELKCPFCGQKLDCMGKYTDGSSKWLCNKCGLFGDKKLFDEIIRTRQALDVAINAMKSAGAHNSINCIARGEDPSKDDVGITINRALEQITELEQKDVK